ncbi:MAG: hypothetical protein P1U41_06805 [Vicingaceae bacterium]|nr:hypothetical protein [Vicingaceae bacterium]
MKRLLIISVSLLTIISCGEINSFSESDYSNTDWRRLKLKGKVKAIKEIKFIAVGSFSEIVNGERVKHIYNKEFLFNLDGFKIEQNDYIPDGTLANRIMYLYQNNQLVEYNEYDSQGLLFGTGKYEIGEDGNPKRLNYKTSDGRYNWSETYKYDDDNNIIEVDHFRTENSLDSKEIYTFNDDGFLSASELLRDGELVSKNSFTTDKDGSRTEMIYGADSSKYTYIYNYDSKGNWVKKIVFKNDSPSGVLIREIEYFN